MALDTSDQFADLSRKRPMRWRAMAVTVVSGILTFLVARFGSLTGVDPSLVSAMAAFLAVAGAVLAGGSTARSSTGALASESVEQFAHKLVSPLRTAPEARVPPPLPSIMVFEPEIVESRVTPTVLVAAPSAAQFVAIELAKYGDVAGILRQQVEGSTELTEQAVMEVVARLESLSATINDHLTFLGHAERASADAIEKGGRAVSENAELARQLRALIESRAADSLADRGT